MDIRKLQRTIVDGLEDVKAQDIAVFNTEHLSPLFERVIIASGTSNRQTKALAASVRDAVKAKGYSVMRTEGEDYGEWIVVDCGAAVVHVMQPAIRDYYHLEEIWGEKPVRMKMEAGTKGLVKAGDADAARQAATRPARTQAKGAGTTAGVAPAAKRPAKKAAAKGARKAPVKLAAKSPARKAASRGAPASRKAGAAPSRGAARKGGGAVKKTPARKGAAGKRAASNSRGA